jgi:hypothetical protein
MSIYLLSVCCYLYIYLSDVTYISIYLLLPTYLSIDQSINLRSEILSAVTEGYCILGCDVGSHWSSPAIRWKVLNVGAALSSETSAMITQNAPHHILEWNHLYMSVYLSVFVYILMWSSRCHEPPPPPGHVGRTVGLPSGSVRVTRLSLNFCGGEVSKLNGVVHCCLA